MTYYSAGPVNLEAVTATTLVPSVEIGTQRVEGLNHYVYVYNAASDSAALTGLGMVLISGAGNASCTISSVSSAGQLFGVAINTIATGAYGWICTRGITAIEMMTTSGSAAALQPVELSANGTFAPKSNTTANGNFVGHAVDAIVSSASGQAFIAAW